MSTATTPLKVKDLLLPGEELPVGLTHTVSNAAKQEGVGAALTGLTAIGFDILGGRVGRLVGELLNVELGSVIGSALTKNQAIADALRSTAEKPGPEVVIPLADHTLTSEYSPSVAIVVDASTISTISFHVVLATTIEGGLLVISRGHIVALRAGRAKLSASLACEGVRIAEHTAELDLPAAMGLPAADAQLSAVSTAQGFAKALEAETTEPVAQEPTAQEHAVHPALPLVGYIENGLRFTAAGTWEPTGDPRPGDIFLGYRLNEAGTAWEGCRPTDPSQV